MKDTTQKGNDGVLRRWTARRRGRWWFAVAVAAAAACPPASGQQQPGLVRATFRPRNDSQGFRWDLNPYGAIGNGTDGCFRHGAMLTVNGSAFRSPTSAMMTRDGSQYVVIGRISGLEVTRRIKVDSKAAAVRYVETFRNRTSSPMVVRVSLQTHLGQSPGRALVTDLGARAAGTLGRKDTGVILVGQPGRRQLSVVFHLADERSKVRPTIQNQSNFDVRFHYALSVEAGKSTSLIHGIAQRRLATIPTAKAAAELLRPFNSRQWTSDLPRDLRRSIANLGGTSFGGFGDGGSLVTMESLGVKRQSADVLAVGEQTRLHGTASCSSFRIDTRYGRLELPLGKIAAVVGQKRTGQQPRVFLDDGQVFSGAITVENLQFTLNSGLKLDLAAETLDRLVMRSNGEVVTPADSESPDSNPPDSDPRENVIAMLETIDGDRLALVDSGEREIGVTTPWGRRQIPLGEIRRLVASPEKIGHQLLLRDGSRLFAFLDGSAAAPETAAPETAAPETAAPNAAAPKLVPPKTLSLQTLYFGVQELSPVQIRTVEAVDLPGEFSGTDVDAEAVDIAAPHLLLVGENVLIGRIDLPAIHFVTSQHRIPVPPNQIKLLRNVTSETAHAVEDGPRLVAELWDGGSVVGTLAELVLPVRSAGRVAVVPLRDVLEVHVPTPTVADSMRSKIAQLIHDLGHPQYARRKAAKEALAELGHLPRLQLDEAARTTSDPEIRRSVEALLEELQE